MNNQKSTGMFYYSNGPMGSRTHKSLVLDSVIGTSRNQDGILRVHCNDGGAPFQIEDPQDIRAFIDALAEHVASKTGYVLGATHSATISGATSTATAPGATGSRIGDQMHAEADSAESLRDLLRTLGLMGDAPVVSAYRIDLGGVDTNDPIAMRKACEAVSKAIDAQLKEGVEPKQSSLMDDDYMGASAEQIRRAIDGGFETARAGGKRQSVNKTVRDVLASLGWDACNTGNLKAAEAELKRVTQERDRYQSLVTIVRQSSHALHVALNTLPPSE